MKRGHDKPGKPEKPGHPRGPDQPERRETPEGYGPKSGWKGGRHPSAGPGISPLVILLLIVAGIVLLRLLL